jgi:Protein of unknown function (DUF4038)/Putative collagen-binding domain of a collagenase
MPLALRLLVLGAPALAFIVGAKTMHAPGASPFPAKAAPVVAAAPAAAIKTAEPAYPLKAGPTGRYLVDQRGRPFLIAGDSPQAMMVNASVAEADRYFSDRAAAGFNAVWVNLLTGDYTGGRANGSTRDRIRPFRVDGDLSTPNDAYFARTDAIVRSAANHGIAVFLDPIETGSWLETLRRNGVDKAFAYGRFVGERYRSFPNIVWLNGNDFQTWRNAGDDAVAIAVARGIASADPVHVQTVELNYLVSSSLDDRRWRNIVGLDAAYTYAPTYAEVLKAYSRPHFRPVFVIETNYEGEHDFIGPQTLRRQEYWTLLSGATGQFYGNKYTWPLAKGWKQHLDTVGSREMTYVTNLFASLRWYDLVPDASHQVLVAGYGWFQSEGSVNKTDYVTAAATPDGRLVVAYLPSRRPVSVDLSKLSGPVRGRWYDPTDGTYAPDAGAPLKHSGIHTFVSPGTNHGGDDDWVLVLQAD